MPHTNQPDFTLACIERPTHLHFIVTGINGPDALLAYAKKVIEQSKLIGVEHILVEDKLAGPRMNQIDSYAALSEISNIARPHFRAVAVVDEQIGETIGFAETVVVNRGLNFALFRSIPEAERWLLGQIDDD